jgi:hypothetical protein
VANLDEIAAELRIQPDASAVHRRLQFGRCALFPFPFHVHRPVLDIRREALEQSKPEKVTFALTQPRLVAERQGSHRGACLAIRADPKTAEAHRLLEERQVVDAVVLDPRN